MDIKLNIAEILFDMRTKSHNEVSSVEPAEARYGIEAGMEKIEELRRNIETAVSEVLASFQRYISDIKINDVVPDTGGGNKELAEEADFYTISLYEASRRPISIGRPLAAALHAMITNLALSHFYTSVAQKALSDAREAEANMNMRTVSRLLTEKTPPHEIV